MQQIKSKLTASAYSLGGVNWPKLFLFYDHDGTGDINVDEFANLLRKDAKVTSRMLSDEMLKHLFAAIDQDNSGKVAYREFLDWLQLDDELALDAQFHRPTDSSPPHSLHPVGAEHAAAAAAAYRKASAEMVVGSSSRGGSQSPKVLQPTGGEHAAVVASAYRKAAADADPTSAARGESHAEAMGPSPNDREHVPSTANAAAGYAADAAAGAPAGGAAVAPGAVPSGPVTEDPEIAFAKKQALAKLTIMKNTEPKEARAKEFRLLLREWHPDKNPENVEKATAVFQFLQKGKSLLNLKGA